MDASIEHAVPATDISYSTKMALVYYRGTQLPPSLREMRLPSELAVLGIVMEFKCVDSLLPGDGTALRAAEERDFEMGARHREKSMALGEIMAAHDAILDAVVGSSMVFGSLCRVGDQPGAETPCVATYLIDPSVRWLDENATRLPTRICVGAYQDVIGAPFLDIDLRQGITYPC